MPEREREGAEAPDNGRPPREKPATSLTGDKFQSSEGLLGSVGIEREAGSGNMPERGRERASGSTGRRTTAEREAADVTDRRVDLYGEKFKSSKGLAVWQRWNRGL